MKILFITRTYPYPAHAGDLLYNAGLVSALARHRSVELSVFCGSGLVKEPISQPNLRWFGCAEGSQLKDDFRSVFSELPRAATRAMPTRALLTLSKDIEKRDYDIAIVSESCVAPCVDVLQRWKLPFIYVSANVDTDIREKIANAVENPFLRVLQKRDAKKYKTLEQNILRKSHAITAITDEDARRYKELTVGKPIITISPGYSKLQDLRKSYSQTNPVAVIVGSFEWNAKIANLESVLDSYVKVGGGSPSFKLRIAGKMLPKKLHNYRKKYKNVEFVGEFQDLNEVVSDARIALVLEELGGGFKLKILDYVFSRLAIVAYEEAMAGSEFNPNTHYLSVDSADAAIECVARHIDNFDALENISSAALRHAENRFDWDDRATSMVSLIELALNKESASSN